MRRDLLLPVVAVLVGVCALAAYGRRCRPAAHGSSSSRQPLQTWENEGGAVPDAAATDPERPAKPTPEPPGA
jgi:hypothetical protein